MAPQKLQAKIEQQQQLREVLRERAEAVERVRAEHEFKAAKYKYDMIANYFSGAEGVGRAMTIGGLIAGSIFALYAIRVGSSLALKGLERRYFRPKLVSTYYTRRAWHSLLPWRTNNAPFRQTKVIMNPDLQKRLDRIKEATVNVSKRGGYFGHLLYVCAFYILILSTIMTNIRYLAFVDSTESLVAERHSGHLNWSVSLSSSHERRLFLTEYTICIH